MTERSNYRTSTDPEEVPPFVARMNARAAARHEARMQSDMTRRRYEDHARHAQFRATYFADSRRIRAEQNARRREQRDES